MVTAPASSSEIWSRAGAICLQGPHHSAQKSTRTGVLACSTSFSKLSSVTFTVLIIRLPSMGGRQLPKDFGRRPQVLPCRSQDPRYQPNGRVRKGLPPSSFLEPASAEVHRSTPGPPPPDGR